MPSSISVGDVAAVVSLLLSVYAIRITAQFNKRQISLIETQDQLNKRLLEQSDQEIADTKRALVGASFVKLGSNKYRLRIFNKGKAPARNVRLEVDSPDSPVVDSEIKEKLPMEVMEQHQSVELVASVHMQTPSKHTFVLVWDDDISVENRKTVYLTL